MFTDDFIAVATHELKTPLTVLKMQFDLIKQSLDKVADRALKQELLNQLKLGMEQVHQINQLTDRLMDVSQLKEQRLILSPQKMNLRSVLEQVIEQHQLLIQKAGCAVTMEGSSEILGEWDEVRLKQVFTNLMSNAMKYGRGRPIEINLHCDGSRAWVSFKDHGIGLAPEHQETIFKRYERVTPKEGFTGLGLGLYIAQQIILAHRGEIRVESRPGEGANFIVELPF